MKKKGTRLAALLLAVCMLLSALPIAGAEAPKGEKIVYGYSGEGRELAAYRFGNGGNVAVIGFAIHGFEDNWDQDGKALVYTAEELMASLKQSNLAALHGWSVYVIPAINPDGVYSGYSHNGPGRCTTRRYDSSGKLVKGGVDMNRCFPTNFTPVYSDRNYTGPSPMGCPEARALSDFIQKVKGSGKNVLIDTHGWYTQTIVNTDTDGMIYRAFQKNFPQNRYTYMGKAQGYLITYAYALGYDTCLFEFPDGLYSMSAYKNSGYCAKYINSIETILKSQPRVCVDGHDYRTTRKEPTCTAEGQVIQTCTRCGDVKTTSVAALGHAFGPMETTVEPTCTREGRQVQTCSRCKSTKSQTLPALGHAFGPMVTTAEPTCTQEGRQEQICSRCKSINAKTLPALGHTFLPDSMILIQERTATRNGYGQYVCMRCGNEETMLTESRVFLDTRGDAFYSDAVDFAYETDLVRGITETTFGPSVQLSRAMMVTLLYRYAGEPETQVQAPFTDVLPGRYYTDAVNWAYENGVVNGMTETLFAPNDLITRQQAATIMFRYAGMLGKDNGVREDFGKYTDADQVSNYALEAMAWCVGNGIINGTSPTTLSPRVNATRAQSLVLLYRLIPLLTAEEEPPEEIPEETPEEIPEEIPEETPAEVPEELLPIEGIV